MLFKKTEKLQEFAELTQVTFASVKPTIKFVEKHHLIPFIGKELYTSLDTAYNATEPETDLTGKEKNLLEACRTVLGPLITYYYTPKTEIKVGDAGAQRAETDKMRTAYQNQVANFREQFLREGELNTESLLEFLEENKTDYPEWVSSEAFADYRSLFIKSGTQFDKHFKSASPHRNYWAMRSKMLDVEQNNIRSLLGDVLFQALKDKDKAATPDFTVKEKDLLFKIEKVTAYLTVCLSIPFLNVRMDGDGFTVMAANRAQDDKKATRQAAADKALDVLIEKSGDAAKSWINNLTDFLNKNAADFEGWPITQSPITTSPITTPYDTGNCDRSGSFGLI